MRNTSRKNISFTDETLGQLSEIMKHYDKKNMSEMIRILIEEKFNKLQNSPDNSFNSDETDVVQIIEKIYRTTLNTDRKIEEVKKIANENNKFCYNTVDLLNCQNHFLDCNSEKDFHSADESQTSAEPCVPLTKSRDMYKGRIHNRSVDKGMLNANRPPENRH